MIAEEHVRDDDTHHTWPLRHSSRDASAVNLSPAQ